MNCTETRKFFLVPGTIKSLYSYISPATSQESSEETIKTSNSSQSEYETSKGRNYEKKGEVGTITVMTEDVVEVLDNCKISYRQSVQIIGAVAHALGIKVSSLILNIASFNKTRKEVRKKKANKIRQLFDSQEIEFATVHWDGKLLPDSEKTHKKVDRVPVLVTAPGDLVQILDVPKLDHSTGVLQANSIYDALKNWSLENTVEAVCCDTTNSNLGNKAGAAVLLEKKLCKDLLYTPCRHHIKELILGNVFSVKITSSTSPEVSDFKNFQREWENLNHSEFNSGIGLIHEKLVPDIEKKTKFIEVYLEKKMPRADYKELLELSLLFLGHNKSLIKFRKPGAMHHARWMSKAIYCLKMFLFRESFSLGEKRNAYFEVCQFIVFIYLESWYTATDPITAPYNDLKLVKKLEDYKEIDSKIAAAAIDKIGNHLWYLSPECTALSFFDDNISTEMKKKMVLALQKDNIIIGSSKKFPKIKIGDIISKEIDYFINNETVEFFLRFRLDKSFLDADPATWPNLDSFVKSKRIVGNLRVVNDVSERAVKLVTDYNTSLTQDEEQKQFLLQVVSNYKRSNTDCKKKNSN